MMMMRSFFVAVAAAASPMRVAWHGPFLSGGGYCSEATTFVLALEELEDVDLTIAQHGDAYSTSYVEGQMGTPGFEKLEMMLSRRQNLDVVICHSEPGAWHVLEGPKWQSSRCPPKKAKIVVGRTMFETDRLPKGWPNRLNAVDEVWVPTEFHRDIFHRAGVQSVYVIGEPVDVEQFTPDGPMFSSSSEFPDDAFVVLSVFKWEPRKGWDILLRAWRDAFVKGDNVILVLLTNAYHTTSDFRDKLDTFARESLGVPLSGLCPIKILSSLPQSSLEALYRRADVLAVPTRGEGWGRPHVEAMASGTPVIATNWSGPTAFLTPDNGYPLRIRGLVSVDEGPFHDHLWADPDPDHLVELLRSARNDPVQRLAKGRQARIDMVSKFAPDILAKQVRDRIATLLRQRSDDDDSRQQRRDDHNRSRSELI